MDSGYYAAYSGLLARNEALDSAASNLANANTNGFRAEREYFRSAVAGPHAAQSQVNGVVNDFGVLGGNQVDLSQGALVHTGNPLDVALQGSGFFAIRTAAGDRYTRDGALLRASNGSLTTHAGEPVLDVQRHPIKVPSGKLDISSSGVVSVDGGLVAQLGVFSASSSQWVPEGADRYKLADEKQIAKPASGFSVQQGSLEASNEDIVSGSLQLMLVQRQAEMMQRALSLFNTNFDKVASEDLPKV
ncbi:MAG: flagellar hook-basal body protein [Acidobacteriaceae bacterium]